MNIEGIEQTSRDLTYKDMRTPSIGAVKGKQYSKNQEMIVIGAARKKMIPQVKVVVSRGKSYDTAKTISNSKDSVEAFRSAIGRNIMETRECFLWMYLTNSNKVVGIQKQTLGTATATQVDVKTGIKGAIDLNAEKIIIAHNHPSGNTKPSEADKKMTQMIKEAASFMGVDLLDSLVITKNDYNSVIY